MAAKCPKCGGALKTGDSFCPQCGENLSAVGKLLFGSFLKEKVKDWTKSQQREHLMTSLRREMLLGSGWSSEFVDKLAPKTGEDVPPGQKTPKDTRLFIRTTAGMASYLIPIILTLIALIIILKRCSF